MGIKHLINIISDKLNLHIYKFDDIYFSIIKSGKIIFFTGYTSLEDIYNFIDRIDMDEFYEKFDSSFSDKDKEKHVNLKAFLWDLYIIAINCGEEGCISKIDKSNIERDRFLARKKIIDNMNKTKLDCILNADVNSEDYINIEKDIINLIDQVEMIVSPENQFDRLVSKFNGREELIEDSINDLFEDIELKNRVECIVTDKNTTSKQKLTLYLKYIMKTENYYNEEV